MPEGVEVCLTALWLNNVLKNGRLINITVLGGRYSRHKLTGLHYFNKNNSFIIDQVDSKGKFMFFILTNEIDNRQYFILNHYGLEGEWGFSKNKYSHIEFEIEDIRSKTINYLYFSDMRNFGTIEITDNVNDLNDILDDLAPDVLKTAFNDAQFRDMLYNYNTKGTDNIIQSRANKEIVKVLMDQKLLFSGLGNYLVSSILFSAKISPYKKMIDIYNDSYLVKQLSKAIKYIVKLSYLTSNIGYLQNLEPSMYQFVTKLRNVVINNPNHPLNFHPDIKLKKKDVFKFHVYRKKKDPVGNPVKADKIIPGRTTYWSPKIQK